jgi:hypothetical protein
MIKVIAAYLPQFHPIEQNNLWWGKGFTEWTNVGKAKKYYKGHYQPRVPADLGYYDLRIPEVRIAQAELAVQYGVYGFCYWHYWFGNQKRIMEMPFNEVLETGKPDFPFCLAWANSSWKSFAYGVNGRKILIEQEYPGEQDYIDHFNEVLPAFNDKRYIRVNDMPFFMIFDPFDLPNIESFINLWNSLAIKNGLKGVHFVAQTSKTDKIEVLLSAGFKSVNLIRLTDPIVNGGESVIKKLFRKVLKKPTVFSYKKAINYFSGKEDFREEIIPSIFPNWDHSPRSGRNAYILQGSNPDLFKKHVDQVFEAVKDKNEQVQFVYLKSWNEWAEGNYMEPDLLFGTKYLEKLKESLLKFK